jgi:hypothetical protein
MTNATLANPQVLLLIAAWIIFGWCCFKRPRYAKWALLALIIVIVSEGQSMISHYSPQNPPTHLARQYSGGCGAMGSSSTSGGC